MTSDRLERVVAAAIAEGALPAGTAVHERDDARPWPVVLLVAIGAWLAAIPLLLAVGMLLGDLLLKGPMTFVSGVLMIGLAVVIFRAKGVAIFVEQLALPALLVGGGMLAFALFKWLPPQLAAASLSAVAVVVAFVVERAWVRQLLGAAAATLFVAACVSERALNLDRGALSQFWLAWHLAFAVWLAAQVLQASVDTQPKGFALASAIESIGAGWVLAVLVGMAWWSGMTFLFAGTVERNIVGDIARELSMRQRNAGALAGFVQPFVSAACVAIGAWWGARNWPALRATWAVGVVVIALLLAWTMSSLGAVLLALMVALIAQRWVLAGVAAVAAAWIIGAFYYQLDLPLAQKALILFGAGVVLAVIAWLGATQIGSQARLEPGSRNYRPIGSQAQLEPGSMNQPEPGTYALIGIAATVLFTLAVANVGIWQKEDVIRHGRPVYVELAPFDPRSLMQGDYMAINFRLPFDDQALDRLITSSRPHAVARVDPRGVATLVRIDAAGGPLAADEMRIELTPKNGRWTLVTDAWFFREGDAERWSKARYGEFRVTPDGKALLVGMADASLNAIRP